MASSDLKVTSLAPSGHNPHKPGDLRSETRTSQYSQFWKKDSGKDDEEDKQARLGAYTEVVNGEPSERSERGSEEEERGRRGDSRGGGESRGGGGGRRMEEGEEHERRDGDPAQDELGGNRPGGRYSEKKGGLGRQGRGLGWWWWAICVVRVWLQSPSVWCGLQPRPKRLSQRKRGRERGACRVACAKLLLRRGGGGYLVDGMARCWPGWGGRAPRS